MARSTEGISNGLISEEVVPDEVVSSERIRALGRASTKGALAELRRYSPQQIVTALQQLPPVQRVEFLEVAERVDEIVPLLPETEFIRTIRSFGIEESGWLVEFASTDQRVAAVDLDCWRDLRFSLSRFFEWIDAMIEAGPETLAAAFSELDHEVWTLAMRAMGDFTIVGSAPEGGDGEGGGQTLDGLVYYDGYTGDCDDRIREILTTALQYAPSHYWSFVYGAIARDDPGVDESAIRWQRNRLGDLGFPDRERAMRAYKPLRVDELPEIESEDLSLPRSALARTNATPGAMDGRLLRAAIAELSPDRGNDVMNALFSLANSLAVADGRSLSEDATAQQSFEKAVCGVERGLIEVSRARNRPFRSVLEAIGMQALFRIGATLDRTLHPTMPTNGRVDQDADEDWNIETEMIRSEDLA